MIDRVFPMYVAPARWLCVTLWVALLLGLPLGSAWAAIADTPSRHRIDLLTVGPADALPSRAGHAALIVAEILPDGRELTTVYNYGDADFAAGGIEYRFLFGHVRGFLSTVGDVYDATEYFGLMQDRDVWRQTLALTDAQAQAVAERLAWQVLPANREYDFHHLDATCTTGIRELLDEVLQGQIAAQLAGQAEPWTIRDYQRLVFDNTLVVAPLADAAFGRRHDEPIDQYFALLWPWRMRALLQQVQVPDPTGAPGRVPLAGPPEVLAERGGPPPTAGRTRITWYLGFFGAGLVLLVALALRRREAVPSRLAGLWLLSWCLPLGLLGAVFLMFAAASTVPELRNNELVFSVLATDIVLVIPAVRWLGGHMHVPRWVRHYATVRLVVVGLAVLARASGLFMQQPWVLPVASLVCGVSLWWVLASVGAGQREDRAGANAPTRPGA